MDTCLICPSHLQQCHHSAIIVLSPLLMQMVSNSTIVLMIVGWMIMGIVWHYFAISKVANPCSPSPCSR